MVCSDLSTFALLIPCQTKASSRAWIDTFFFRASAMLPLNQHMVFNMEHIPSTTIGSSSSVSTSSGVIGYSAVVASEQTAGQSVCLTYLNNLAYWLVSLAIFLNSPYLKVLKMHVPSSLFIIEANIINPWNCVPQAICELYAYGQRLQ
jgi:hypothetical protein